MTASARRRAERFGRMAESAAIAWLVLKGFRILARRWRGPAGEIDIVARRGRLVAFVEVKARPDHAAGLEAVTAEKRRRLTRAAANWIAANPAYAGFDMRFDLILIAPWRLPSHLCHAFETTDRSIIL